jgi:hypothetical protein
MLGRQKVRRLMSEENLKAIQPRAFKPKTTDSKGVAPAPNLLAEINIRNVRLVKSASVILLIFGCAAASFVIWQCGRTKSREKSSVGVYRWK